MANKISIISDISADPIHDIATYCYRIDIDSEYITGRGVFKKYTPDSTILETLAQEMALSHLLSWFTLPKGSNIVLRMDHQGARQNVHKNRRTGVSLRRLIDSTRLGGIEINLYDIKGDKAIWHHEECHKEANRLRKNMIKIKKPHLSVDK